MFKVVYLFVISILLLTACNEKKAPVVESGLILPPNVIEVVDQRYPSEKPNEPGVPRKATYIDTTSNEKIMERAFYKNKKVYMEINYGNNVKNGPAMAFRDGNGNPWSLHTYTNDTLDGPYKTWHENGNLFIEGQYVKGQKAGNWRFFNQNGELDKEVNFNDTTSVVK
jgi:antitoxin component YwqK of YwqJK toxin-antitoxin module